MLEHSSARTIPELRIGFDVGFGLGLVVRVQLASVLSEVLEAPVFRTKKVMVKTVRLESTVNAYLLGGGVVGVFHWMLGMFFFFLSYSLEECR